jgi:hypothetical protein
MRVVFRSLLALLAMGCMFTTAVFAADTVIGFDDFPASTEISTQYHDRGVDLDTKLGGGASDFPNTVAATPSFSAPNVLDISRRYPVEIPGAYLRGVFTDPHHRTVSARVHGRGFPAGPLTGTTTLTAYDLSGNIVASVSGVAPPPDAGFALLAVTSANADIARFEVACGNDLLFLDDLTFDSLQGAPKPDFSLFGIRTDIAVAGTATSTATVRRFAGSVGNVSLALSNLPPGVFLSGIVPNPVNGPDGASATITLTADATATPVQDWPVTITGTPSSTAGQYGPHSVSFPLTILDAYDAQIVGIEVTQGIQPYKLPSAANGNNPLHGTPVRYTGLNLAAGGKTLVRVFPNFAKFPENSPPPDFYCTLAGTRNGVPLSGAPLVSATGPGGLILGPNFVTDTTRARPNGVCNFVLPPEWTSGTISLTATLNTIPSLFGPPPSVDCCVDNDSFTLTDIGFAPTRDLFFAPFALRVNRGALGFPDDVFEEARNLLPIADNQFHMGYYVGEIDVTDIWNQDVKACGFLGTGSCAEDATGRGASVAARLRDIADDMNFTDSGELVVGIYPQSDPVSGNSDRIRSLESIACAGPFWDCDELSVIAVQNSLRPLTSVAHELGHMLGRPHASFACGAGDVDNNGAAEHWLPDEQGFIQGVGVDRRNLRVLFPDRSGGNLGGPYYDFMSYCANVNNANDPDAWISTHGWLTTLQTVATGAPSSVARIAPRITRNAGESTAATVPVLVVQAFIDIQGNAYITKVLSDRRHVRTPPSSSPYRLTVLGRSGQTLSDTPMTVATGYVHQMGAMKFLSAQVPVNGAEAVEIHADDQLLARRVRSKQEPKVWDVDVRHDTGLHGRDYECHNGRDHQHHGHEQRDLTDGRDLRAGNDQKGPYAMHGHDDAGDEYDGHRADVANESWKRHECDDGDNRSRVTVITWKTKHVGKEPLVAKVDYSTDDGKDWRPIFFGPNRNRAEVNNAVLGHADKGRVRVRLSDGFNESTAISRRFRELGAPPMVRITSPEPGTVLRTGGAFYVSAQAYDDSHRIIPGEQLSWYAGSQLLGTGQSMSVPSLSPGKITIGVVARDDLGRATAKYVAVEVAP